MQFFWRRPVTPTSKTFGEKFWRSSIREYTVLGQIGRLAQNMKYFGDDDEQFKAICIMIPMWNHSFCQLHFCGSTLIR